MDSVKSRLQQGEVVFGHMVLEFFTPGIAQIAANSGAEFIIYDMEHGACDIATASRMIWSCKGSGISPWVRVPDLRGRPLSRVLDLGAQGVMIPRVETGEQMRDIVAQLKYAPQGKRGVALGVAHDDYRVGDSSYFAKANRNTLVIALIETPLAVQNLDEIVSTPGLDIAWLGHYDLTVAMEIPTDFSHERFLNATDALLECCQRHGVAAGFLPSGPEDALRWIRKGFTVISLSTDIQLFATAFKDFRGRMSTAPPRHESV